MTDLFADPAFDGYPVMIREVKGEKELTDQDIHPEEDQDVIDPETGQPVDFEEEITAEYPTQPAIIQGGEIVSDSRQKIYVAGVDVSVLNERAQSLEIWYWEHKLPEGIKTYSKTKPIQKSEFDGLKKWWKKHKENEQAWKVSIDTIAANDYNLDIKNPHILEEKHVYSSAELVTMLHESFRKSDELLQQLRKELENG